MSSFSLLIIIFVLAYVWDMVSVSNEASIGIWEDS